MPVGRKSTIAASLLAAVLIVVFATAVADTLRFNAIKLARYVSDEKSFDSRGYVDVGRREITVTYNETVRRPSSPATPTPVDCSAAKSIGVMYLLQRSRPSRLFTENVTQDVTWRHQGSEDLLEKYSVPRTWWSKDRQRLMRFGLTLDSDWRQDGVISLEVRIRGQLIVEDAFALRGCA